MDFIGNARLSNTTATPVMVLNKPVDNLACPIGEFLDVEFLFCKYNTFLNQKQTTNRRNFIYHYLGQNPNVELSSPEVPTLTASRSGM